MLFAFHFQFSAFPSGSDAPAEKGGRAKRSPSGQFARGDELRSGDSQVVGNSHSRCNSGFVDKASDRGLVNFFGDAIDGVELGFGAGAGFGLSDHYLKINVEIRT